MCHSSRRQFRVRQGYVEHRLQTTAEDATADGQAASGQTIVWQGVDCVSYNRAANGRSFTGSAFPLDHDQHRPKRTLLKLCSDGFPSSCLFSIFLRQATHCSQIVEEWKSAPYKATAHSLGADRVDPQLFQRLVNIAKMIPNKSLAPSIIGLFQFPR